MWRIQLGQAAVLLFMRMQRACSEQVEHAGRAKMVRACTKSIPRAMPRKVESLREADLGALDEDAIQQITRALVHHQTVPTSIYKRESTDTVGVAR